MSRSRRLVAMRCRGAGDAGALDALSEALAEALETPAREIGSPSPLPSSAGWREDLESSRGCLMEAGGQVGDALRDGGRPVLVAGDGAVALATLPALAEARPDARILWLDAHAAFAVPGPGAPATLRSMALSGACGAWPGALGPPVDARRIVLCGVRALAEEEQTRIASAGATVIGTALETLVFLQNALDGAATYIHLDPAVLDSEARGGEPEQGSGGLAAEKLFDLLDAVADSCEIVGVELSAEGMALGDADRRAHAQHFAGLLAPVL